MPKSTSWDEAARWYEKLLSGEGTYQSQVILPNLIRLLEIKKGEVILDIACGLGFFADKISSAGAKVIGVDISKGLLDIAKKNSSTEIIYHVSPAHKMPFIKNMSIDKAILIFAIQNIENAQAALNEAIRVLKSRGKLFIVMNHPAFRIPKESSWGWDETNKIQYRRIDRYLSESKVKIQTHPGERPNAYTLSFHRPLQFYFKALRKAGFFVSRLEEWNSNRKSETGPRSTAENTARKEIPLFLALEAIKARIGDN